MSTTTPLRLSGLATIVGGALFTFAEFTEALLVPENLPLSKRFAAPSLPIIEAASWLASVMLLLGLTGLYVRQAQQVKRFGLVAFLLAFFGTALNVGSLWSGVLVLPPLAQTAPEFLDSLKTNPPALTGAGLLLSFYLFPAGWVLFGVASLIANSFPRWAILLVMVGLLGIPFIPTVASLVAGIGLVWLGYSLWSHQES
jgi:uncharacterized membrane protein